MIKDIELALMNQYDLLIRQISSTDARNVILGLLFLRHLLHNTDYAALSGQVSWKEIQEAVHSKDLGGKIEEAMASLRSANSSLKPILPNIYTNPEMDQERLREVVNIISKINPDDAPDLLRQVFDDCLDQFDAMVKHKEYGSYYTPKSIIRLMVSLLNPSPDCVVYDPCCGIGNMFTETAEYVKKHHGKESHITVFGQEMNTESRRVALMRMMLHGVHADLGEYAADTLTQDLFPDLKSDMILANPPFNQRNWIRDISDQDPRWAYGQPPSQNANYAWLQHMIYHLKPEGRIGVIMANGALSSARFGEADIRAKLIEADLVECVIALPAKLFSSVAFAVSLWILNKRKKQPGKTLFLNAEKKGYMMNRTLRALSDQDIQDVVKTCRDFQNGSLEPTEGYCAIADIMTIKKSQYSLVPGRYVGMRKQTDEEPFEETMTRLTSELSGLISRSHELEEKLKAHMEEMGYEL